jgi:hypothetical protein
MKNNFLWIAKMHLAFAYGFNFHIYGQQGKFFLAFWTFSIILLDNFVWWFKFKTFIQNMVTTVTNYTLRHPKSPDYNMDGDIY